MNYDAGLKLFVGWIFGVVMTLVVVGIVYLWR